jgi:carbon storage regulator
VLVLTRRVKESLIIDDNIIVTVLAVDGDKVKIGINAPREVTILRQELSQAVLEQNLIAARLAVQPEPETFQGLRKFLAEDIKEEKPQETNSPSVEKEQQDKKTKK